MPDLCARTTRTRPLPASSAKAIFLDRDGVLNRERGDYTWLPADFDILPGVPDALRRLHAAGYRLIVITNQAGVTKGLYTLADVDACHQKLQAACGGLIDAFYVAPGWPTVSETLSRKPDSLLLERALARFGLDPARCWMLGDRARDIEAGQRVGVRTVRIGEETAPGETPPDAHAPDLVAAAAVVLAEAG